MPLAAIAVVAALILGCGDSPTGPSSGTRVEAVVQDTPLGTAAVTGTVVGNVHASLWNGSRWVDLGSPNGITIPLQIAGRSTTVHGEASAPAGSYSRVRLTFQGATARLNRGSVVGGVTLGEDTTLGIGGSDNRVEVVVDVSSFTLEASPNVRRLIAFDLRSQQWLTLSAVQAGRIEDEALQAAVTASTRAESR